MAIPLKFSNNPTTAQQGAVNNVTQGLKTLDNLSGQVLGTMSDGDNIINAMDTINPPTIPSLSDIDLGMDSVKSLAKAELASLTDVEGFAKSSLDSVKDMALNQGLSSLTSLDASATIDAAVGASLSSLSNIADNAMGGIVSDALGSLSGITNMTDDMLNLASVMANAQSLIGTLGIGDLMSDIQSQLGALGDASLVTDALNQLSSVQGLLGMAPRLGDADLQAIADADAFKGMIADKLATTGYEIPYAEELAETTNVIAQESSAIAEEVSAEAQTAIDETLASPPTEESLAAAQAAEEGQVIPPGGEPFVSPSSSSDGGDLTRTPSGLRLPISFA